MIVIISGTNRKGSMTLKVAKYYYSLISQKTDQVKILSLEDLHLTERAGDFIKIEKELLIPADKFIFIMPEYNGSFPGILKLMIDNSDIQRCWWHKKAAMVGVADGRGGNLRGIEHMTNILHYLKMNVHYHKLPISKINDEMDEAGNFQHTATQLAIQNQIEEFLNY